MSRINTNVSSMVAQRALAKNNNDLQTSMKRLSTGLRINTSADDPAGLIASENLRAEKAGLTQGISVSYRTSDLDIEFDMTAALNQEARPKVRSAIPISRPRPRI